MYIKEPLQIPVKHIPSDYKGIIKRDAVIPSIRHVKFIPKYRYDIIQQAFYNINYFRR